MAGDDICDSCKELVFKAHLHSYWGFTLERTLEELQRSAEITSCPFCKAFLEGALLENLEAHSPDTRYFLNRRTGEAGFAELAMYLPRDGFGRQDSLRYFEQFRCHAKDICHWMVAYAKYDEPEAWPRFHKHSDWQTQSMDVTTRFDRTVDWLEGCVHEESRSHLECSRVRVSGYPSRLIDVEGYLTSGCVRLVESQEWQAPFPEYTTLSHCWGASDGPRPLRTILSNLEAHKTRIPKAELPKTFRDAIEITRRVGKSFIWIDSLAIIQDDQRDWEREAANMAAIYENSFLTIAATSSENCMGGCDLEPWSLNIVEATVTTGSEEYHRFILPNTTYCLKLKNTNLSWKDSSTLIPLHTRGWVLQEAVLSRRVLHMSTHHMLWHCRVAFDQEDVDVKEISDRLNIGFLWKYSSGKSQVDTKNWSNLVKRYSQMLFTHISDRVPAIAGIINAHAADTRSTPLLGLWKETLVEDLHWWSHSPQHARIPGLPTWTWLSHEGVIYRGPSRPGWTNRLVLDSWKIQWERQPYVSKLVTGVLNVSSKILEAKSRNSIYDGDTINAQFKELYAGKNVDVQVHCSPDVVITDNCMPDVGLIFMMLSTRYPSRSLPTLTVYFLMIHPSPDNPSAYVRFGTGEALFHPIQPSEGSNPSNDSQSKDVPREDIQFVDTFQEYMQFSDMTGKYTQFAHFKNTVLEDWEDAKIQLC